MSLNDPISDMLTRIRNASLAGKESVRIDSSKIKQRISEIFKKEGFIKSYLIRLHGDHPQILIELLYTADKKPVIQGLKRISTPGRRVYAPCDKLPHVINNYGLLIVSTSSGVVSGKEARKRNVGGEIICSIW